MALSSRPFTLVRPSGDAESEIRISFDATSTVVVGSARDRDEKGKKGGKTVSQERDRDAASYLFRLFGNNPTERLLLLRTLAVPCRWGTLAFSCASLLLFSQSPFLSAFSRRLPADSAPTLHSSTSTGRNRQHRSDERPHGPALKGYRFHVTGVTKRYLRARAG